VRLVKSSTSVGRVWRSANCTVPMAVASFRWSRNIPSIEINSTGSAGRFENLIWCLEVIGSTAHVYSWSNSGTASKIAMRQVRWDSDLKGKLLGKEVEIK
jgi:hypothetical protein